MSIQEAIHEVVTLLESMKLPVRDRENTAFAARALEIMDALSKWADETVAKEAEPPADEGGEADA